MDGFLSRHGITRYRRLTTTEHDQLVALAAGGMIKSRIAAAMKVSFPTVVYHLADHPRPRLETFKKHHDPDAEADPQPQHTTAEELAPAARVP